MGITRFYKIQSQKPFVHVFPWNSKTYLSFYQGYQGDFKILISSNIINEYIKPKIHICSHLKNELTEIMNTIPTQYHWKMDDYYLEITSDQEHFCIQCYILMYLENNYYDIDLTITIARKDYPIYLYDNVEIKNTLKTDESSVYIYYPNSYYEFYLNVTVFKGKIYLFDKQNITDSEYSNLRLILDENDGIYDYQKNQIASREGIHANKTLLIDVNNQHNNKMYQLKVFSNFTNETIYQIEIIDKNQAIQLKLGQPQQFYASQQHLNPLYFVIPNGFDNSSDDYYSITIESVKNYLGKSTCIPEFNLKHDRYNNPNILSDYHDFDDAKISILQEIETITYIQIPSITGLYFLTINPPEIIDCVYQITLGNKDFNILAPKSQRLVRTKVGEQKIWEIHIHDGVSQLFVQIQLCGGIVHVYGSASRDELTMGYYRDKIESVYNRQLIGTISSVQPKSYYLNTQTIKSTTQTDVVSYILRFDILYLNTIVPINHFYPGNGGEFQISIVENHLHFDFLPIQSSEKSSQDFLLESITYTLIYQKQSFSDNSQLDKCNQNSQYSFNIRRIQHDPQNTLNQRLYIGEDEYEKILASIQAIVNIKTNNYETLQLSYYYNTQILESKIITHDMYNEYTKGIFIIILTVLLLAFFLLIIKYRDLKQIAKFEAIAQQSIPQQEQQIEMNYTNLRLS